MTPTPAASDDQFSPHFSFEELTVTNRGEQEQALNRAEAVLYKPALRALALRLLEPIRGDRSLVVNSAFRAFSLNKKTPGSSLTSQHPLGQAGDIHRPGQSIDNLFDEIVEKLSSLKIPFGQVIKERARRDYGISEWVHVSLGRDFWRPERCGEVATMVDGKFTLLKKIPQEA